MEKHYFDLFRLWLQTFFKHPVENIRQANPIIPGRLYHNFGNICKAKPYRPAELDKINSIQKSAMPFQSHDPDALLHIVRSVQGNKDAVSAIQQSLSSEDNLPPRCMFCDFHLRGVPCPIYNTLADGSTVCDTHRYIIIRPVSKYV